MVKTNTHWSFFYYRIDYNRNNLITVNNFLIFALLTLFLIYLFTITYSMSFSYENFALVWCFSPYKTRAVRWKHL